MGANASENLTSPAYSTVISPNDHMWLTSPQYYFEIGVSAIECIRRALTTAHVTPQTILDFPCGHGRVCRMLRAEFPAARITVCDLDRDGVDFCATEFHATPVYGHEDLASVAMADRFDLIWCGSLFTHLDRDQWPTFLGFFADHLANNGVLVFTTHGRQPVQWMIEGFFNYGLTPNEQQAWIRQYSAHGFGFVHPSNQAFGLSLSSLAFVCGQVERWPSLKMIGLHEAGWAGHQDVIACVRMAAPFLTRPL